MFGKKTKEGFTSPRGNNAEKGVKKARKEAKKTANQLNATTERESPEINNSCLVALGNPATLQKLKEAYRNKISSVTNNGIVAGRAGALEGIRDDYLRAMKALKYNLREGGRYLEIDPNTAFEVLGYPENQEELDSCLEEIIKNLPHDDDISEVYYRRAHNIASECFSKAVTDQADKNIPVEHLKTLGINQELFENGDHNTRISMFNKAYRSLAAKLHPDKNRDVESITSDAARVDPSLQPFIGKTPEEAFKTLVEAKDALHPVLY